MAVHKTLKVEVGHLLANRDVKEGVQLSIWFDDFPVLGPLQLIILDILNDILGDLGPSHLRSMWLLHEIAQLGRDGSGDSETRGFAITLCLIFLGLSMKSLKLLIDRLLQTTHLILEHCDL